ncbi:vitamin B12 ABC transporter ATP-binding protein BtuD [Pantoea dispersa]|uniref:vitamin B12 ABC transporter ATP-binding protein BtuD n=1 Tax=Pantoea TaxID=53335 RepID=UPI0010A7A3BF|nr:vitamin B12 ABC transporter ATP-binding protein BtuD [Pantoea sp. R102]THD40433.1 vitamin B12 ABC transporter ATP-binding protein BtuD [Pantoea sp. R102]
MLLQCHGLRVPGRLSAGELTLCRGERVHVVGPNGAGKSTLLTALAGLLDAEGQLTLAGQPLRSWSGAALAQQRAWLPQQQPAPAALPVWHYLRLHSPPGGDNAQATLTDLQQQLGLQDKLTRPLAQLSGGEWQRVRLAAVVLQIHPAINPRGALLILDEPLTALDIAQQRAVDKLLLQLSEAGIAIIASGHDLNHSLRHADRVWLMHQGRVVSQGRAREVLTAERLAPLYQAEFVQLETPQGPLLYLP